MRKWLLLVIPFLFIAFAAGFVTSCENGGKIQYYPTVEEMNRGVLKIQCDEALQSIMLQQAEIFELNFAEAKVEYEFLPEQIIVENLLNGTTRTAIISRRLSESELKKINDYHKVKPREHVAAKNAIAIVRNKANSLPKFTLDGLKHALQSGTTTMVVEGKQSYMAKTIAEALKLQSVEAKLFALNTADSVVNYVKNNKDVVGFVSYSAISDEHSYKTAELLKDVDLVPIELIKNGDTILTSANQSDIFLNDYPLVTPINYIVTDFTNKLSIGYVNFLFRAKSGRIFLHAGVVPSVMPEREIVIDTASVSDAK